MKKLLKWLFSQATVLGIALVVGYYVLTVKLACADYKAACNDSWAPPDMKMGAIHTIEVAALVIFVGAFLSHTISKSWVQKGLATLACALIVGWFALY